MTPTMTAKFYFDDHYGKVFGPSWPSIRLALLSQPKHCALINNFAPAEETSKALRDLGCLSIRDIIKPEMDNILKPEGTEMVGSEEISKDKKLVDKYDTAEPIFEEISMPETEVEGRIIKSSDKILTGVNNAHALQDFIPSNSLRGMDEFVEEEEYYKSYNSKSQTANVRIGKKMDFFHWISSTLGSLHLSQERPVQVSSTESHHFGNF